MRAVADLVFVGIDVIAEHLSEINVTGATGFRQLEQLTGQRLQENVVDYLLHERSSRARPA